MNDKIQNMEKLRKLIDEKLLNENHDHPDTFLTDVRKAAEAKGINWDAEEVLDYWWWLARIGGIAFPGELATISAAGVPRFLLTKRGRSFLEKGEKSPHNPQKYYNHIKEKVNQPDIIVMTYLDESVGAWANGLYRSCVVMLGCACERLILILAEAVSNYDIPPWSDRLKKMIKRSRQTPVSVSQQFDEVREALLSLAGNKKLSGKLANSIERKLTPIYDLSRGLRNQAGHPSADEVSSEHLQQIINSFFYPLALLTPLLRGGASFRAIPCSSMVRCYF